MNTTHTPRPHPEPSDHDEQQEDSNTITPLPGEAGIPNVEARRPIQWDRKGVLALAMVVLSLVAASGFAFNHYFSGAGSPDEASKLMKDKPSAASEGTRKLDMALAPAPHVPALVPYPDEVAEPIGVRRSGQETAAPGGPKGMAPEDAPVLVLSSRPGANPASAAPTNEAPLNPDDPTAAMAHSLEAYQRQLQTLLENMNQGTAPAPVQPSPSNTDRPPQPATGLFGGQLQGSDTPKVAASLLGDRSLTLPKGTAFTCALKTKVISATSGLVGCQVQRNVYGDNGRVLLIERGSHLDGEYRTASVKTGSVRIPVLWTRVRTPYGVTVDIESPGTGQLGESGIDGYADNRWGERIGAAMLLSLIDDSVKLVIQNQSPDTLGAHNTIVLPSTTDNTSKLAEKVLESTINIPPLLYQNQGGIVGIYVARDVDFSSVYALKPVQP